MITKKDPFEPGEIKIDKSRVMLDDTYEDPVFAKETAGKAKLTLVPRKIIWAIARVREYGNAKYPTGGPDNWKTVDDQDYRDAAFRHFLRYLDDPDSVDKESGISHLDHLACNIAFLIEKREERKEKK